MPKRLLKLLFFVLKHSTLTHVYIHLESRNSLFATKLPTALKSIKHGEEALKAYSFLFTCYKPNLLFLRIPLKNIHLKPPGTFPNVHNTSTLIYLCHNCLVSVQK